MACFLGGHSQRDVLVDLILQMKLQLLGEVQLRSVPLKKRTQAERKSEIPAHGLFLRVSPVTVSPLTVSPAPSQSPKTGASTALARGADISRRPESANKTWRGDCFPSRPTWRESSLAARGDAARDRGHPGSPARPLWKFAECVVRCPNRAWAEGQGFSRSTNPECLEQDP